MQFIFPHLEVELIQYSKYISTYFSFINAATPSRVLKLNKSI